MVPSAAEFIDALGTLLRDRRSKPHLLLKRSCCRGRVSRQELTRVDVDAIHSAREALKKRLRPVSLPFWKFTTRTA